MNSWEKLEKKCLRKIKSNDCQTGTRYAITAEREKKAPGKTFPGEKENKMEARDKKRGDKSRHFSCLISGFSGEKPVINTPVM